MLPEVGDLDKPKLVFFFDEAHLLFKDASKDFLGRSRRPCGSSARRASASSSSPRRRRTCPPTCSPSSARGCSTRCAPSPPTTQGAAGDRVDVPKSGYDLERVLQELGTGEAIVTVMSEKGAPTPVAWTRLRAPQGSCRRRRPTTIDAAVKASPLLAKYGTAVNPESATETMDQGERRPRWPSRGGCRKADRWDQEIKRDHPAGGTRTRSTTTYRRQSPMEKAAGEAARTLARELIKCIFKRRR